METGCLWNFHNVGRGEKTAADISLAERLSFFILLDASISYKSFCRRRLHSPETSITVSHAHADDISHSEESPVAFFFQKNVKLSD